MAKAGLALVLIGALSTQACTVVLPVALGTRAAQHNREARELDEDGEPSMPQQSVGLRVFGGLVGGAAIDALLVLVLFSFTYTSH